MTVKLLMTWDILPGHEQDYFEFVVRDFIPGMQGLGLEPSDAWFTMYGDQPQIMVSAQMDSLAAMQRAMRSTEWLGLTHQLLEYVNNFEHKIVESKPGFQI